jgi:nucleotide-binding universal stress UspA family protein
MSKLKILVPLDGTEKSMHSLKFLKIIFSTEDVEVTLINVVEVYYRLDFRGEVLSVGEYETAKQKSNRTLDLAERELNGYKANKLSISGSVSDVVLKEAKDASYDMILMTKSSVKGISRYIGSVINKVIHHSDVAVIFVPE